MSRERYDKMPYVFGAFSFRTPSSIFEYEPSILGLILSSAFLEPGALQGFDLAVVTEVGAHLTQRLAFPLVGVCAVGH